jgi:hypothetical protein
MDKVTGMRGRAIWISGVLGLAVFAAGCVGASKSANPLSPTVAGPIPGVNITTPSPMQPVNSHIPVDQQPVTLTVTNAATNGVRPVSYLFEIATDSAFTNKVFTREGVTPNDSGQTSLKLPDPLATGHTYFWRSKAQDGANASEYSNVASFDIYTPIVIQAPVLVTPVGNVLTDSLQPRFTVNNAVRSGPVGAIQYVIEISDTDSFASKLAVWTIPETPGTSGLNAPGDLPANKQIFWHARAADPTTVGPFSTTAVFRTPAPVVVTPPPSGGGGGGGGSAAADQINLGAAAIVGGGPSDVAGWAATTSITHITFSPSDGLSFVFDAQNSWPNQLIPGWGPTGYLQYTVWACVQSGGWRCGGFIQMWKDRPSTGAPLPSNYVYWWGSGGGVTAGIFGGYVPHAGDTMAFFVTAGNERADTFTAIRERSNVVLVTLPSGDSGSFSY